MRWSHHRAHRRSYVAAVIALLAVSLSVLSGCTDTKTGTYQDLGSHVTTMKVLNGTYLTNRDGHLLVLSGTEVHSPETSQVFLYDIDQRELLFSSSLDNSVSMTAFCQAGETLYFATIASESTGCDVYAVDDRGENFRHVVHLDEKGIYSLEWNGQQELLIGTAYPANLYGYTPETDTLRLISDSLTDENFVFNISYLDGYCYLGIGTNAEFLKVDCQTGEYQDILPAQYADQASVYDQIIYQDEIYLFLSPDGEGVRYEPETGTFAGIGTGEPLIQDTGEIAPEVVKSMAEAAACLNITERLLVRGEYSTQAYQTGMKFSYYDDRDDSFYGVDISGFLHQYQDGVEVSQVNLGALLEPTYITPTEMVASVGFVIEMEVAPSASPTITPPTTLKLAFAVPDAENSKVASSLFSLSTNTRGLSSTVSTVYCVFASVAFLAAGKVNLRAPDLICESSVAPSSSLALVSRAAPL